MKKYFLAIALLAMSSVVWAEEEEPGGGGTTCDPCVVPEPGSIALMSLGLAGLYIARRRPGDENSD